MNYVVDLKKGLKKGGRLSRNSETFHDETSIVIRIKRTPLGDAAMKNFSNVSSLKHKFF